MIKAGRIIFNPEWVVKSVMDGSTKKLTLYMRGGETIVFEKYAKQVWESLSSDADDVA